MATTVTASDLKTRLVEFESAQDTRVDLFIADAQLQINATQWGDLCELGVIYLAAHLMCTVGNTGGSGAVAPGPIKKEKVGEAFYSTVDGLLMKLTIEMKGDIKGSLDKFSNKLVISRGKAKTVKKKATRRKR